MKRLTMRNSDGRAGFAGSGSPTENTLRIPMMLNRLAEYEDAEEQGLLVWLPCKVGDSYFIIRKYCDEHGELPYATEHWGSDCLGCSEACNGEFRIKEGRFNDVAQIVTFAKSIGKTIFLTREEAEKALEKV